MSFSSTPGEFYLIVGTAKVIFLFIYFNPQFIINISILCYYIVESFLLIRKPKNYNKIETKKINKKYFRTSNFTQEAAPQLIWLFSVSKTKEESSSFYIE